MAKHILKKITVMMTLIPVILCTFILNVQADVAFEPIEPVKRQSSILLPALAVAAAAAVLLVLKARNHKK
jgi:hypothetical protein